MELERDDIVVTYDASVTSIDELLKACEDSGFPAAVVTEPPVEPEKAATGAVEGEDPDFFLAALARAKEERKPIVLDFSAEWCAPCQQMIRNVFPDPRVAELLERFVFVTIDTDEYPALAQKFGVVGMPDIRLLSSGGEELKALLGFRDADAFAKELQALLDSLENTEAVF